MGERVSTFTGRDAPALFEADEPFIGESVVLNRFKVGARSVAPRGATVMLLGETGVGKEVAARYIHRHSPRTSGLFVAVDCSAFSESLFESQLFGHVKGSFTGAACDTLGFARAADAGTLFLDEVGELPFKLQAKFLRMLQERCVVPVGRTQPIPVDFRVICATHRDLRGMVADGLFRQDLYFRLNVIPLRIPPLRERADDIGLLANHFLGRIAQSSNESPKTLSEQAVESLTRYEWPGNIRELFNVLENAHVLSVGRSIELSDLPAPLNNYAFLNRSDPNNLNLRAIERRSILEALKRTQYNRAAACRLLGVEKRRLNRLIALHGIPLHARQRDA